MTFSQYEQSNDDGQPVGLYLFTWGNSAWAYNSADRDIIYDGITYTPLPVKEKALVQGAGRDPEFTLTVPENTPVADLFRGTPPSVPVVLTVRRVHFSEPVPVAQISWIAPVQNIITNDVGESDIVSRNRGLRKGGLRLTWSRTCTHFLFGSGCFVVKSLYANSRIITGITGNVITVDLSSPTEDYFDGGFVEWDADGNGTLEQRAIEVEIGDKTLKLFGRSDGLSIAQSVTLYPGCDHTNSTCDAKFDNLANSDALDFMPNKSPYDGEALI